MIVLAEEEGQNVKKEGKWKTVKWSVLVKQRGFIDVKDRTRALCGSFFFPGSYCFLFFFSFLKCRSCVFVVCRLVNSGRHSPRSCLTVGFAPTHVRVRTKSKQTKQRKKRRRSRDASLWYLKRKKDSLLAQIRCSYLNMWRPRFTPDRRRSAYGKEKKKSDILLSLCLKRRRARRRQKKKNVFFFSMRFTSCISFSLL